MSALSGSRASTEPVSRLGPSGFDAEREAASLTDEERRYLISTPLQEPMDAGLVAYYAKAGSGNRFAGFARRQRWLFQRLSNSYGTAFAYRLSADGRIVREAAIALAGQSERTGA